MSSKEKLFRGRELFFSGKVDAFIEMCINVRVMYIINYIRHSIVASNERMNECIAMKGNRRFGSQVLTAP